MSSPEFPVTSGTAVPHGVPAADAWPAAAEATFAPSARGPCAPVRAEVDSRCTEATRLAAAAESRLEELRTARRQHAEVMRAQHLDGEVRNRRRLADEKTATQADYRAAIKRATDRAGFEVAAATWLRRTDELNRRAREAQGRADTLSERVAELERSLVSLELASDGARIAAETAQAACMDARRTLAVCEEQAARSSDSAPAVETEFDGGSVAPDAEDEAGAADAARTLMGGDRQALLGVALRLAEETGAEAGRVQLLLLELREQITARALEDFALAFPDDHPFWSQFANEEGRNIAASLASLGYRFDGGGEWADGRVPSARDLSLALSYCGYDPRGLRRPAGQAAIDALWQGTKVRGESYLLALAPDLALEQLVALLGARATRLGELWDIWGRLRPLLIRAA
jgi:hypothetical protein